MSVVVIGVGMVPFATPRNSAPYDEMAEGAVRAALTDAGVGLGDLQQAYASYVYGDSTCGQRALYRVGTTGIPIINVNNNCSSGSTALFLARQAVESGAVDCVLAFGFEQMQRGPSARSGMTGPTRSVASPTSPSRRRVTMLTYRGRPVLRRRRSALRREAWHRPRDLRSHLCQVPPARREQPPMPCSVTQ